MANKNLFGWLKFGSGIAGVAANVLSTILTNKKNEQLARMQNAFQKQENELAYQRAKPTNQVSQMMQAGMSKAGALNAINGGATYQPAPITSATAEAPQIDLSSAFDGLIEIGENAKQRKLQEDLLQKNIEAAKAAQKAQFEENERQRKHDLEMQSREHTNTNRNADNRLEYDRKYFNEVLVPESKERINQLKENTSYTREQRKHFEQLRPILKENAEEEVNKLREEVKSITSLRNLDVRRFALEKIKVHIESYFGVGINELRNTLSYWENHPETLYKGFSWRRDALTELDSKEDALFDYIDNLTKILDEIDKLETN